MAFADIIQQLICYWKLLMIGQILWNYVRALEAFDIASHLSVFKVGKSGNNWWFKWIKAFLTTWSQRVVVNGTQAICYFTSTSRLYPGPTVAYILMIINSVISHSNLKMFADDLTLHRNVASVSDCELLQWDLIRIYEWTLTWLLWLDPLKCEALNIINKRSPIHCNCYHSICWF